MSKFRKKPVEIEAVKFTRNNWDEIKSFTNDTAHTLTIEKRINGIATCIIPTLEGQHIATEGDWIIKGVKGEFYPCKPDIFDVTCAVKYFKATKNTKRFNANQRVWITLECANHLYIRFKYRGKGRYVNGLADKFAKYVGEIKSIEVSKDFASKLGVSD